MDLIRMSGMMGVPLLVLTLVIAGLIVKAALKARTGNAAGTLFSIMFWGFTAAVLGFLGQCAGLYNALTAISNATEIDPRVVSRGMAESFSTTLWGGGLLISAGIAWLILKTLIERASRDAAQG